MDLDKLENVLKSCGVRTRTLILRRWRKTNKVLSDLSKRWAYLKEDVRKDIQRYMFL